MQHKCRVTVIDKKLYPELQAQYCADPNAGACPIYNVGDTYVFERYGQADDFWQIGLGTLTGASRSKQDVAGSAAKPHCSEAWDAISRYIYTALQGGSIMRGWMNDERVMIACCSDGTRPVVFKIERIDYKALHLIGWENKGYAEQISAALTAVPSVTEVSFRPEQGYVEVYLDGDVPGDVLRRAVEVCGDYVVTKID